MSNMNVELAACTPTPVHPTDFNQGVDLPYGLMTEHIYQAMSGFIEFLGFINQQLYTKKMDRLESMLMPANFSSMVGEFMAANIPTFSKGVVKNQYHNGHPDLIPTGCFPNNAVQHADEGIEIKGSRYLKRWQGHNPEDTWLMVFCFDSNRPADYSCGIFPKPFQFLGVFGARLKKEDWLFAGRSETSRRTITASVTETGYRKMTENWIYKSPELR